MANRERGEVGITVDGRTFTLRPTINAICELEDLTGKPFADVARDAERGSVSAMRLMMWCYLHDAHGDEIKTPADAGLWMQRFGSIVNLGNVLSDIAKLNMPDDEEKKRAAGSAQGNGQVLVGAIATLTHDGSD